MPSESICNVIDLSKAQEIGEHDFQMFITWRLEGNPPSRKFTDPIRKQELESSQEEADTCMVPLLHLAHISQYDFSCAVIASIDADVTLSCLANYHKFSMPLFQKCCSETRMKYVDIASIGNVLGGDVCEPLRGMHAITGCDSKQFCWERKIVCILISEEERFIPRTFCKVWPLLGIQ